MITYSISKSERKFEYQQKNPIYTNVELRGNLNKRASEPEYHEFNQFRKMNIYGLPNSKRTLNPEFAVFYINIIFFNYNMMGI